MPEQFREARHEVLAAFIARHPLAVLVGLTSEGLTANHVPLLAQWNADGSGLLRGHIARANSFWRDLKSGAAVLAVFNGADAYISPRWYPSKREHGKVVPTWNYATVHVKGTIAFTEDATWLRQFVAQLTDLHEAGATHPWALSDAPEEYVQAMLRAIIGFEIKVTSVEGKFKGSQNRSAADRAGVAVGLREAGRSATEIAQLAPQ
jgi:transcriptional regulator